MTRSQHYRSRSLPFSYRENGIQFDPISYTIDGDDHTEFDLNPARTEIDLTNALPTDDDTAVAEWETLTITADLHISEEVISAVFPSGERDQPPAKLYVTIRCHETIYRDRVLVTDAPTMPGTYEISIPVKKDQVRGTVELRPYLARTRDRDGTGEYASQQNFRVASGTIYNILIDRPEDEEPPSIDGEQVSFSQTPHLPGGEKLYYLDFRNEKRPKLWINADHPRITEVLQSQGSVGAEARMRDVILDQIGYGVWQQLVVRAAAAVDDDGNPEHEWQQTVLETFARNMYDVDDLNEAIYRLRTDIESPASLPHMIQRLDEELQEYLDPREQLIKLMEEGLQI
ncbi:hypothetical protein U3A55_13150 [Salarchaeum sp. III]|uniref:hypothetical protein n=1 Tax=Salarchaeum sp. III TaxID=3107927 RepID=UPI002ED86482